MNHKDFSIFQERLKDIPIESWMKNIRFYGQTFVYNRLPQKDFVHIGISGKGTSYRLPLASHTLIVKEFSGIRSMYISPFKDRKIGVGEEKISEFENYHEGPGLFLYNQEREALFSAIFVAQLYSDLERRFCSYTLEQKTSASLEAMRKQDIELGNAERLKEFMHPSF